jgi:hypothetical protein
MPKPAANGALENKTDIATGTFVCFVAVIVWWI